MTFLAGAGRAEIEIPDHAYPVDGFAGQHDALFARVLLLDDGSSRVAVVVVDQTSIPDGVLQRLTDIIGRHTGAGAPNILVSASHTFCAPHVQSPARDELQESLGNLLVRTAVEAAVQRAAVSAATTLRAARIGFGGGHCNVNTNRDVLTADGWWLGVNDAGRSDKQVIVARVEDIHGRPIALLMNYAVQSSVMNESVTADGRKLITADLAGAAATHVEQHDDPVVAMFLIGAAGDQAPYWMANRYIVDPNLQWHREDLHEHGFLLVDLLGRRLGDEVLRVSAHIRPAEEQPALRMLHRSVAVDAQAAPAHFRDLKPTRTYRYRPQGQTDVPVWILQLGEAVLIGLQAELSCATGESIKQTSPYPHTMIATMVNGAAKYLPDAQSYDRMTYEAMSSRYAVGSAEIVASHIRVAVEELSRIASNPTRRIEV